MSREAIQARLTPEEEANQANQAVERIIRRQQDQDDLERHKDALLGQGAILDQQIEGMINSGRVVWPDELRALVGTFLRASFPNSRMVFDEQEPCATLDVDAALGHHMRRFIEQKRINNRTSAQFRSVITDRRRLSFTFDNDFARQRPNLEFITIRHPLAEAALEYWAARPTEGIPAGEIQISGPAQEQGLGYFFIYLVKTYAATQATTLETVIALDSGGFAIQSAAQLLRQIQEGAPIPKELARSDDAFAAAERAASRVMAGRRTAREADARGRNRALLLARTTSIRTSFDAKLKRTGGVARRRRGGAHPTHENGPASQPASQTGRQVGRTPRRARRDGVVAPGRGWPRAHRRHRGGGPGADGSERLDAVRDGVGRRPGSFSPLSPGCRRR